jgi:hypothetical protein
MAVGGPGVWTTRPPSMAAWIIDAFLSPLIYLHQSRIEAFLGDLTVKYVSGILNGWINPLFFLTMVLMLVGKTPRLTRIFRYVVLSMIPLCWVALLYDHVYPREGYILWTVGMLLVLFSNSPEMPRSTQVLQRAE